VPQSVADHVYLQADWEYQYLQNESPLAMQLARLGISGFMSTLRDHLLARITGKAELSAAGNASFAYFSGHDTTLSAVLGASDAHGDHSSGTGRDVALSVHAELTSPTVLLCVLCLVFSLRAA